MTKKSADTMELKYRWNLTKKNLFDTYKAEKEREWKKDKWLQEVYSTPIAYAEGAFFIRQNRTLSLVERKGYLNDFITQGFINYDVKGKTLYLRGRDRMAVARRRGKTAPLWGYGPDDTEIIMRGGANLTSSTHWIKATYTRWIRTYLYCTQEGLDFRDMDDWAEASKSIDEQRGSLTLWDVLRDTG